MYNPYVNPFGYVPPMNQNVLPQQQITQVNGKASVDTIQLYKDGIAQEQAQSTGTNPSFVTLVQVTENNSCCPCASGTKLQLMNTTETVLANVNVSVTKIV